MNEFVTREKKAAKPINVRGINHRFLDADLAREGGKITVTNLYLHGVRPEMLVLEPGRNVCRLFAETAPKPFPVLRIVQESFFATDAFDVIAGFKWAIIFAKGELLQLRPPGTNQRAE